MTFLDATPDVDTKVALIKTLITVSEGKARKRPLPRHGVRASSPRLLLAPDLRGG
jgi:hypothetical protein